MCHQYKYIVERETERENEWHREGITRFIRLLFYYEIIVCVSFLQNILVQYTFYYSCYFAVNFIKVDAFFIISIILVIVFKLLLFMPAILVDTLFIIPIIALILLTILLLLDITRLWVDTNLIITKIYSIYSRWFFWQCSMSLKCYDRLSKQCDIRCK